MVKVTIQQKFIDFANVFKAFIGCTYLSMPFAFSQSGIALGSIMVLIVGWLNGYCSVQIVKCKDIIISRLIEQFESKERSGELPEPESELIRSGVLKNRLEDRITLGHIAKYAFGKKGQWVVTICLFISQFGFCVAYFVFVGNSMRDLIYETYIARNQTIQYNSSFPEKFLSPNWTKDIFLIFMMMVPVPIFILFSLLRSVRNMGWISMIANCAIGLGYFAILGLLIDGFSVSTNFKWANFQSVAVIFGILTSAFEGIGTVIPIETSMIGNRQNFSCYLYATIAVVICVLGSFGIIGHMRFGSNTQQIILQNLPSTDFITVVNIVLIVSVICTYPLQMFPIVEIAEFLFFRKRSAQFVEDRIQILSDQAVNVKKSDFDKMQAELLSELRPDESDYTQCKRFSDESRRIQDIDNVNYGSVNNNYNTESYSNENIRSTLNTVYTKKQLRMVRVLYGSNTTAPAWKRNIIRISVVLFQLALAVVMRNNFAYLGAFIGAIGSSFLCYILPAATYFKLTRSTEHRRCSKIGNIIIVVFGVVGSITSLTVTIGQMI